MTPFSPDPTLHCIATGVVSSTSANADDAQSIRVKILDDMVDQEVNQYTFPMSSKAKTLAAHPEIEVNGEKVSVNPRLFQSVAISTQTDEARQEAHYFSHMWFDLMLWVMVVPMLAAYALMGISIRNT